MINCLGRVDEVKLRLDKLDYGINLRFGEESFKRGVGLIGIGG